MSTAAQIVATRALLARIRQLRVLVVGDVMLDHCIWGDATRISPEAPVPVVALAAGADLERAAHFANAAAGVVVGKAGTATVTPDELLAHLAHTS